MIDKETTWDLEDGEPRPKIGRNHTTERHIGPYRVERLIARGGMGRVYLATREDDYEQRVALKLVETGPENLDVIERFYRERQILASLQHPNVARILDGGTTDEALPYFVMEYVEGEPIDRYCQQQELSLRRRLELFQEVCAAVQYAHQNLVVHRDLKPGNILVTADGVPKLLDFGIAKILDTEPSGDDTRPGETPMTPGYASPEQFLSRTITTASDVYSLGVLLYHLVSGQSPYLPDHGGPARRVELICNVDPPPPSAVARPDLRRQLAGDVDAIVLKAMSKKPERRYTSAAQMAEEVRRHLADLPVEAHPESWIGRARKRVRRHRLELAAVLLILAFAMVTTVLWRRAVHKERQAREARTQAERALRRAERVSGFLEDLFKSGDPNAGALNVREILDRGRRQLTSELEDEPEIRSELLATLGAVYDNLSLYPEARELKEEALDARLTADPAERPDLAADLNNLGTVLYNLGDYAGAAGRFGEALAMWKRLGDERNVVRAMRNLAATFSHSGRHAEAMALHRRIAELQRGLFGDRDPAVARSLFSLGALHRIRGEPDAAEPLLRQALDIFTESLGPRHTQVADVSSTLGRVLHAQGRHAEARQSFEQTLELRLQLLGEDHVAVANTRKNLAALLIDQGEIAAAEELLDRALTTLRRAKPAGDWTVADAESIRGSCLAARGRAAAAEALLLAGYRTIRGVKGDEDIATHNALQRLLDFYDDSGRGEEATAFRLVAGLAVERRLAAGGLHAHDLELSAGPWRLVVTQHGIDTTVAMTLPDSRRLGPFNSPAGRQGTETFLFTLPTPGRVGIEIRPRPGPPAGRYELRVEALADVTPDDGERRQAEAATTEAGRLYARDSPEDTREAREHYGRALSHWQAVADPGPGDLAGRARTLAGLANLARSFHDPGEAAELFRRALPLWQKLGDRENEAITLNRLGLALDDLGESSAARQVLERALGLWQQLEDRGAAAMVRRNICLMLQRQGEFPAARACYREARDLFRELADPLNEILVLSNLAGVHWTTGEPDRALELYDEVLAYSRAHGYWVHEGRALSNRANVYAELGDSEQALSDYGRALEIYRRHGERRREGLVLSVLGTTYLGLGENERGRAFLEEALALRRATGDGRGEAGTLRALGTAYRRLEQWPEATDAFARALAKSRELADRRGEATAVMLLGETHAASGRLSRAIAELGRAVELQGEIGDRRQRALALLELGEAYRRMDAPEEALPHLHEALKIFRAVRDPAGEMRTLEVRARAERARGHGDTALADAGAALALLEDLRVMAGASQRAAFLASRRSVYELYIDLLMERHRAEPAAGHDRRAFAASEAGRARVLLELVNEAGAHLGRGIDEALGSCLRTAEGRLAALTQHQMRVLGGEHDEAEAAAIERDVQNALTELERERAELRRQSPRYAALSPSEVLDAAAAGTLLEARTLLLEYVLGEERGYLWALGPDSLASFELPGRAEIEALARRAHRDLTTLDLRTGKTAGEALDALGRLLLAPVAERLAAAERLVIVADGALHYMPFAAFPQPLGQGYTPLVASHEVVHLPSASVLALQRRHTASRETPEKVVAILADPVFDAADPRLSVPPPAEEQPADEMEPMTRAVRDLGLDGLGRLPATRREAEAIAALVEPSRRLLALGFDANRERALGGELAAYRYLHFATHGLVNPHHPELSGLVLSQLDPTGERRDGFIALYDIYGLELSAELVVLSGCHTGLGKEIHGEGLVGLTRGFMYAGVPRVVASLWQVRDEATAALMERFYHGMLVERKRPAAALRAAQLSIHGERRWADPSFWAAFVLQGDWR